MPGSCHIQIRSGFLVINMSPVSNVFTISDALCSMDVFCKRISWALGVENESCESNFASQSGYQMFQLTEVKNTHCPSGKNKNKSPCHLRSLFKKRKGILWALCHSEVGGRPWNDQVWIGLQWSPSDVTSGGGVGCVRGRGYVQGRGVAPTMWPITWCMWCTFPLFIRGYLTNTGNCPWLDKVSVYVRRSRCPRLTSFAVFILLVTSRVASLTEFQLLATFSRLFCSTLQHFTRLRVEQLTSQLKWCAKNDDFSWCAGVAKRNFSAN